MKSLFIRCGFVAALFCASITQAATLKIATLSPDGSAWLNTLREASAQIKKETDGRVSFRFYPGGVMGNNKSVLKKIRIGQLHGAIFSGGALSSQAADTQSYNLPLLFRTFDEVDYVRSKLDSSLEKQFDDAGWVNFGLAEGGFAYIMSGNPIVTTEDMKKNKIWIPSDDPASKAAAETFEINPVSLHLGDVLAGLQTNLINTVTSSPIATIALQWHTQVSYLTDMPLLYFYGLMAINKKAYNKKVSVEDQKIVNRIMRKAFKEVDKNNRIDNEKAYQALLSQGIKAVKPNEEQLVQWHAKTDASTKLFLQRGGISQQAFDTITSLLAEYRAQQTK